MPTDSKKEKMFFLREKPGHFVKDCRLEKRKIVQNVMENRKRYKCGKGGHLSSECKATKAAGSVDGSTSETALATLLPSVLLPVPSNCKSGKWMLYSTYSTDMARARNLFVKYLACDGVVKVEKNDVICSYGYGDVKVEANVAGKAKEIVQKDVLFKPEIMFNMISISKVRRKRFLDQN